MKFRNETELKEAAFAKGATVAVDGGRVFNTGAVTVLPRRTQIEETPVEPAARVAARARRTQRGRVARAVKSRDQKLVTEVKALFNTLAPVEWDVEVVRDKDRLIKSMRIKPLK